MLFTWRIHLGIVIVRVGYIIMNIALPRRGSSPVVLVNPLMRQKQQTRTSGNLLHLQSDRTDT